MFDKFCQWFSPGTPVSSTNKTDIYNIAEILLKVVLVKHHNPLAPIVLWTSIFYSKHLYRVHLAWSGLELITFVAIGTDCIVSYKSIYHAIMTTMVSKTMYISYGNIVESGVS
jgi:hypothetical protein